MAQRALDRAVKRESLRAEKEASEGVRGALGRMGKYTAKSKRPHVIRRGRIKYLQQRCCSGRHLATGSINSYLGGWSSHVIGISYEFTHSAS